MKRYDWRINAEGEEEEYSTLTGRYMHADEVLPQVQDLERNIRILTDACESWKTRFSTIVIIIRKIADEHMATGELSPEVIEMARTALDKWEPSDTQQALASEMGIEPSFSEMNPTLWKEIERQSQIPSPLTPPLEISCAHKWELSNGIVICSECGVRLYVPDCEIK